METRKRSISVLSSPPNKKSLSSQTNKRLMSPDNEQQEAEMFPPPDEEQKEAEMSPPDNEQQEAEVFPPPDEEQKEAEMSPAFEDHIFWPSAKEKTKNSSKQIFPACASDRSWRELFRLKNITKSKPIKDFEAGQKETSSNNQTSQREKETKHSYHVKGRKTETNLFKSA